MRQAKPRDLIVQMGFPLDRAEIIHGFIGGSALHGVKLHGTDDTDVYGVFIERPWLALGIGGMEHFVRSTSPQTRRNVANDVDVMCYSLRKWASLVAKGNPTILHSLFTPAEKNEPEWSEILRHRSLFLARSHARRYMGYAESQLKRMQGLRGLGKHGQRPELISKYGYDTKAAMHTLRLLYEGIELMKESHVTLPRAGKERELLLHVRRGEWPESRIVHHASKLFDALKESAKNSDLPEKVDLDKISELVGELYLRNWTKATSQTH